MSGHRPASLALALAALRRTGGQDGPTLSEATARLHGVGRLAIFPLLAVLGMTPSPGLPLGAVCGALIIWLATQALLDHPPRPLPHRLGRWRIPLPVIRAAIRLGVPPLRRLEKLTRPRLPVFTLPRAAWASMIGQGAVMALPIPFGNVLPGVAVIILSVALLRQDGAGVLAGHALSVLSLAVLLAVGWSLWQGVAWMT